MLSLRFSNSDGVAILKRTQLLELFAPLERRRFKSREAKKKLPGIGIDPDMLQPVDRPSAFFSGSQGNRRATEVKGSSIDAYNSLDHIGIVETLGISTFGCQGRHDRPDTLAITRSGAIKELEKGKNVCM